MSCSAVRCAAVGDGLLFFLDDEDDDDAADDERGRMLVVSTVRPVSASPIVTSSVGGEPVEDKWVRFSAFRRRRLAIWCFSVARSVARTSRSDRLRRSFAREAVNSRSFDWAWSISDCFACSSLLKESSVSLMRVFSAANGLA